MQYRRVCIRHNHGIPQWQDWLEKSHFAPLDFEPMKIVTLRIGTEDYNPADFPHYTPYYEQLPAILPITPTPNTPTQPQPNNTPAQPPIPVTRLPRAIRESSSARKRKPTQTTTST